MLKITCAYLSAALIFALSAAGASSVLKDVNGNKEYYLYGSGSDCVIVDENDYSPAYLAFVKGVCVKNVSERDVLETIRRYEADLVFSERFGSVTNYYYYSNKISGYKLVKGKKINIHAAFDDGVISIGTPLIFGSY